NLMPIMDPPDGLSNIIIVVKGNWTGHGFMALVSDGLTSDQSDGGAYCFPLHLYEDISNTASDPQGSQESLFSAAGRPTPNQRDGLTNEGFAHFQRAYSDQAISREDVFYYIYGLLHSSDY